MSGCSFARVHRVITTNRRLFVVLCVVGGFLLSPCGAPAQIQREIVKGGVEHWYLPAPANGESYLSTKLAEIYNVLVPSKDAQPFGKSVAFLAGVSTYTYLTPQLPSVHNDLVQMRDFLLKQAGFDEVYVASDGIVTRDLIESYIKGTLAHSLHKNDRLLFYYSGHGGDNAGQTGYMLFANAQKGQFYGNDVLPIDSLKDWGQELQVQHILLILDSCASGLGIASKSGTVDSDQALLQALSGNGSRTVLTAGTANEATYAEDGRQKTGNSFFTKALLNAFDSQSAQNTGFITVGSLFSDVEIEMGKFRAAYGKATTPRIWKLQEMDYRGTFVFLNPRVTKGQLTREQAKALGVTIAPKGDSEAPTDVGYGALQVSSATPGRLFIDGQDQGSIRKEETRDFYKQTVGTHHVMIQAATASANETKDIKIDSGSIASVYFGLKSPIDTSGKVKVGTLEVESTHQLAGDVYVDNTLVGHLESNGKLAIANLIVGPHDYRIVGALQVEGFHVEIKENQTEYQTVAPAPPTNLSVTVH
jgi:hypothetical protein